MESWKAELYHHGVQGQKWGVRRYQNADGSLTAAGKKHQSQSSKIKSSNSAESSSGGGGGGGVELDDEELDELDKELERLLGWKDPQELSKELNNYDDNDWDVFCAEVLGKDDTDVENFDAYRDSVKKAMLDKASKPAHDAKKEEGLTLSKHNENKEQVDKWRKKKNEDKQAKYDEKRPVKHSSSGKAYVGSLGMKWKINR